MVYHINDVLNVLVDLAGTTDQEATSQPPFDIDDAVTPVMLHLGQTLFVQSLPVYVSMQRH